MFSKIISPTKDDIENQEGHLDVDVKVNITNDIKIKLSQLLETKFSDITYVKQAINNVIKDLTDEADSIDNRIFLPSGDLAFDRERKLDVAFNNLVKDKVRLSDVKIDDLIDVNGDIKEITTHEHFLVEIMHLSYDILVSNIQMAKKSHKRRFKTDCFEGRKMLSKIKDNLYGRRNQLDDMIENLKANIDVILRSVEYDSSLSLYDNNGNPTSSYPNFIASETALMVLSQQRVLCQDNIEAYGSVSQATYKPLTLKATMDCWLEEKGYDLTVPCGLSSRLSSSFSSASTKLLGVDCSGMDMDQLVQALDPKVEEPVLKGELTLKNARAVALMLSRHDINLLPNPNDVFTEDGLKRKLYHETMPKHVYIMDEANILFRESLLALPLKLFKGEMKCLKSKGEMKDKDEELIEYSQVYELQRDWIPEIVADAISKRNSEKYTREQQDMIIARMKSNEAEATRKSIEANNAKVAFAKKQAEAARMKKTNQLRAKKRKLENRVHHFGARATWSYNHLLDKREKDLAILEPLAVQLQDLAAQYPGDKLPEIGSVLHSALSYGPEEFHKVTMAQVDSLKNYSRSLSRDIEDHLATTTSKVTVLAEQAHKACVWLEESHSYVLKVFNAFPTHKQQASLLKQSDPVKRTLDFFYKISKPETWKDIEVSCKQSLIRQQVLTAINNSKVLFPEGEISMIHEILSIFEALRQEYMELTFRYERAFHHFSDATAICDRLATTLSTKYYGDLSLLNELRFCERQLDICSRRARAIDIPVEDTPVDDSTSHSDSSDVDSLNSYFSDGDSFSSGGSDDDDQQNIYPEQEVDDASDTSSLSDGSSFDDDMDGIGDDQALVAFLQEVLIDTGAIDTQQTAPSLDFIDSDPSNSTNSSSSRKPQSCFMDSGTSVSSDQSDSDSEEGNCYLTSTPNLRNLNSDSSVSWDSRGYRRPRLGSLDSDPSVERLVPPVPVRRVFPKNSLAPPGLKDLSDSESEDSSITPTPQASTLTRFSAMRANLSSDSSNSDSDRCSVVRPKPVPNEVTPGAFRVKPLKGPIFTVTPLECSYADLRKACMFLMFGHLALRRFGTNFHQDTTFSHKGRLLDARDFDESPLHADHGYTITMVHPGRPFDLDVSIMVSNARAIKKIRLNITYAALDTEILDMVLQQIDLPHSHVKVLLGNHGVQELTASGRSLSEYHILGTDDSPFNSLRVVQRRQILGGMSSASEPTIDLEETDPNLQQSFSETTPIDHLIHELAEQATVGAATRVMATENRVEITEHRKTLDQLVDTVRLMSESVAQLTSHTSSITASFSSTNANVASINTKVDSLQDLYGKIHVDSLAQQAQHQDMSDTVQSLSSQVKSIKSKSTGGATDTRVAAKKELKRQSIAQAHSSSVLHEDNKAFLIKFFKLDNDRNLISLLESGDSVVPSTLPPAPTRSDSLKHAAKVWYEKLTRGEKVRYFKALHDANSNERIDISSGQLPPPVIDAAVEELYTDFQINRDDDWESRLNYMACDSGYMNAYVQRAPSAPLTSSAGGGPGVMVVQRQTDTIPDVLKLHKNVQSISCKGSVLYHLINFQQRYLEWLSNPGNTPDSVRLVYAVPTQILKSVIVAACNRALMDKGGYTSINIASIPNDLFIRMMFRMMRPTSTHEFLMVLADAARFPAYPDGKVPDLETDFDMVAERSFIYCDKIVTAFNVLCTDIENTNIVPTLRERDLVLGGLGGLFVNNFNPAVAPRMITSLFNDEQKALLDDVTFQQYVLVIKQRVVFIYEGHKTQSKLVTSLLTPLRAPNKGEILPHQAYQQHRMSSVTEDEDYEDMYDSYNQPLSSRNPFYDVEYEYSDEDLAAFQQPSAPSQPYLKPPPIGKQFDDRAFKRNDDGKPPSRPLFQPKSMSGYPRAPYAASKQPVTDTKQMGCLQVILKGSCSVPGCKFSHDESIIKAAHERYKENIKKFFDPYKKSPAPREALQSIEEPTTPTDDVLLQELSELAQFQGYDDNSLAGLVESFSALKTQEAPTAASKNFSAVHMDGDISLMNKAGTLVIHSISNILLDTGAIHGNYIVASLLKKWMDKGMVLKTHAVNTKVRLGDNKTLVDIKMKVEIPVQIMDPLTKKIYEGTVLCSVIEGGGEDVPIIIGLPSIGRFFTKLVVSVLEHYASTLENESEYLSKLDALDLKMPWSAHRSLTAIEEVETSDIGLYESLSYLSTPRSELIAKHTKLVDERTYELYQDHSTGKKFIDMIKTDGLVTFVPETWEGFKNVQGIGANENDEFPIEFKDSLPDHMPCQPRAIAERLRGAAIPELHRLMTYLLTHSSSAIASPVVIAPKATDPFVRVAGDYRLINLHVYINQEYIPRVQYELQKCKEFTLFMDFDLTNSFHQIKLDYESSSRLSLSTVVGLLRPKFLPEGVSCGSMMLQKIVRWIFREIEDYSIILFDNILILAHDIDDAYEKCKKFLEICRRHNVILKMAKTFLLYPFVTFFGYTVRNNTVSLSDERKAAIMALAFPRNLKEAQSFLGASIFFKTFVRNFSEYAAHMAQMTSGKFVWDDTSWAIDYKAKFEEFKQALCDASVVHLPDYNLPWVIQTDGSNLAVGGVLFQIRGEEYEPIAFVSHKLSDTATRWDIHKIECFAIYLTVFKLSHLLLGKQFVVETDHSNLLFMEKSEFAIVIRWRCYLQQFAFFLRHIPGKNNVLADYLSRMFSLSEEDGSVVKCQLYQHLSMITNPTEVSTAPTTPVNFEGPVSAVIDARPTAKWNFLFDAYLRKLIIHHDIPLYGFQFLLRGSPIDPSKTLTEVPCDPMETVTVVPFDVDLPTLSSITNASPTVNSLKTQLRLISEYTKEYIANRNNLRLDSRDNKISEESTTEEEDTLFSPEQCITCLLNLLHEKCDGRFEGSIARYRAYAQSILNTRDTANDRALRNFHYSPLVKPIIGVITALSHLCDLPFLSIPDLIILNRDIRCFSMSLGDVETYIHGHLPWHEYRHYARNPCGHTSSVRVESEDQDCASHNNTRYGVSRTLLVVDLHNLDFPAVHFTHELLISPPGFNTDIYTNFVQSYVNRNINSASCSISTIDRVRQEEYPLFVIVRYTGYYSEQLSEEVPPGFRIFRIGGDSLHTDYVQRWALRFVQTHLFLPSIQYIRVLKDGHPVSMHVKWPESRQIGVFDIFVVPVEHTLGDPTPVVYRPNEIIPVATTLIQCILSTTTLHHRSALYTVQPVLTRRTTCKQVLDIFKAHMYACKSALATNIAQLTLVGKLKSGEIKKINPNLTGFALHTLSAFQQKYRVAVDTSSGYMVRMNEDTISILSDPNVEIARVNESLLYFYEERVDPHNGAVESVIKGTNVVVNMKYWLDTMEARRKMTQGPPDLRRAERAQILANSSLTPRPRYKFRAPLQAEHMSSLYDMSSQSQYPSTYRFKDAGLWARISEESNAVKGSFDVDSEFYYDNACRSLTTNNLILFRANSGFTLIVAAPDSTGIAEAQCPTTSVTCLDDIAAILLNRCDIDVACSCSFGDNNKLFHKYLRRSYIMPYANVTIFRAYRYHILEVDQHKIIFDTIFEKSTLKLFSPCDYMYMHSLDDALPPAQKEYHTYVIRIQSSEPKIDKSDALMRLLTFFPIPNPSIASPITELIHRFDFRHFSKLLSASIVSQELYDVSADAPLPPAHSELLSVMTRSRNGPILDTNVNRDTWSRDQLLSEVAKRPKLKTSHVDLDNYDMDRVRSILTADDRSRYYSVDTNYQFEDGATPSVPEQPPKRRRLVALVTTEPPRNPVSQVPALECAFPTTHNAVEPMTLDDLPEPPHLEVECKFHMTDALQELLNARQYGFSTMEFTDVYFDTPDFQYTIRDIWIRQRGAKFEVKKPTYQGHVGAIRKYMELTTPQDIVQFFNVPNPDNLDILSYWRFLGLVPFASIDTHRISYQLSLPSSTSANISHNFQIDIDSATLHCSDQTSTYCIAEIELATGSTPGMTTLETFRDIMEQLGIDTDYLHLDINGKLIEALFRHNPPHYNLLVHHGIVKLLPVGEEGSGSDALTEPVTINFDFDQYIKDNVDNVDPDFPTEDELEQFVQTGGDDTDDDDPDLVERLRRVNEVTLEHMQEIHTGKNRKWHKGPQQMYLRCKELYPGNFIPFNFFEEYVGRCGYCQKIRARFSLHFSRLFKTIKDPSKRRSAIGIDVLHIGHPDEDGNTMLIVIVQFFSRHVYAYPTNTYSANTIVEALMSYYCLFGLFDVLASDPGSDLIAQVVRLFNANVNVEHRISMVDEHGSTGVENQGCKKILEHLKQLVMHNGHEKIWSKPVVLGYAIMVINNSVSSETGFTPFEAIFGKPDEAWLKTILPPDIDPPQASTYLKNLWQIQRDITRKSVEYQMSLHDKRVSKTPWEYQKKYPKGDYVLKFRDEVLKTDKLFRYRYLGPYVVNKHEVGSNFVYCTHMSTRKEYVFPVDKIIPFFCTNEEEARKVATLDDQSVLMMDVKFYRGNPAKRTSLEFLIRFEDDPEDEYNWYPYSADLISTDKVREYCEITPELSLLTRTQQEENVYLSNLRKQRVTSVKPDDTVYIDLRTWSYDSEWFNRLKLPEASTKTYLVEAVFRNGYLNNGRKIDLRVPLFDQTLSVDEAFIYQFGSRKYFDPAFHVVVDENLVNAHPAILEPNQTDDPSEKA